MNCVAIWKDLLKTERLFHLEQKMSKNLSVNNLLIKQKMYSRLHLVTLGVIGFAYGCGARNSMESESLAAKATNDSSIRDVCLPTDGFCHEVLHAANGVHFAYTDGKRETTTLTLSLGYFGNIIDAGVKNQVEFTMETEKSVAVVIDWHEKRETNFMREDSRLNLGTNPSTMSIGRCHQNIRKINAKSVGAHALVYRSGVAFESETTISLESERWRLFKVIKDTKKDESGLYKGMIRSQYTVNQMFEDCFSDSPRIYGDQTALLKKDLETWAKNNLVIKANSFGIYNATGSQLMVRSPDGKKYQVKDRSNYLFDRENLNKSHYVYNPTFGSCYKWTPQKLDFNYWAVLKTSGIGGCKHGAGCLDLEDDKEGPTYHHHGAKGPCAGLDSCELKKGSSSGGSGLCE
jgi:hypothetical protein